MSAIVGISVNWMVGWANPPRIRIHVGYDEADYQKRVQGIPWTPYRRDWIPSCCLWTRDEGGGRWSYLFSNGDKTGYGGRVFNLLQTDGSFVPVKGPWSSSPNTVRNLTGVDLVDTIIIDRNGSHYGGAAYEAAEVARAIKRVEAPVELALVEHGGGRVNWEIVTPKPPRQSSGAAWNERPRIAYWPPTLAKVERIVQTCGIPAVEAS